MRKILLLHLALWLLLIGLFHRHVTLAQRPQPTVPLRATQATQRHTREEAIALARECTGFADEANVEARFGQFADSSVLPFFPGKHTVWQITFDEIQIIMPDQHGAPRVNPHIHTLTVLLDDATGLPMKIFSPRRLKDGLRELRGYEGLSELAPARETPKIPFIEILTHASKSVVMEPFVFVEGGVIGLEATEINGYYGVPGRAASASTPKPQRHEWIVDFGSFNLDYRQLALPSDANPYPIEFETFPPTFPPEYYETRQISEIRVFVRADDGLAPSFEVRPRPEPYGGPRGQ